MVVRNVLLESMVLEGSYRVVHPVRPGKLLLLVLVKVKQTVHGVSIVIGSEST